MGAPALLTLSLVLSVGAAAGAWLGGRMVEALSEDPALRDRLWGTVLLLPVLPPAVVALLLLTPAPVREIVAVASATPMASTLVEVGPAPAAASQAFAPDPTLTMMAILAGAGLLAVSGLVRLALGARRVARLIGGLEAPDPGTLELVREVAARLSAPAPDVGVSAAVAEPMLVGVMRPRLVLPAGLTGSAEPDVVRAMIAHELAHLKRGDHRAIWVEGLLLAVLAFNPLMPVLRDRRAAAREEVCDRLALADAAPPTRRAYAESLIGALRRRAGPQPLPALSFTGAGRRTAMRRLKAVMCPAAPAGGAARLLAAGGALAVALAAGAGSLAIAGEREAVVRIAGPEAASGAAPKTSQTRPDPATTAPGAVEADDRQEAAEAFSRLNPDQQTRFRNPTAVAYRDICASADAADGGFCAGVMFSVLGRAPGNGVCAPVSTSGGPDLDAYVERGKAAVAGLRPGAREDAYRFAERALRQAHPCEAVAPDMAEAGATGVAALADAAEPPAKVEAAPVSL